MKKILILGSSGLLGSNIYKYLSQFYNLVGHSLNKKSDISFDLLNESEVFKGIQLIKPQIIINCVALADVDMCEKNLTLAKALNINIIDNIIKSNTSNSWIIHFSTDHVYNKDVLNKETEVNLTNNYSVTKYLSEKPILESGGLVLRTNFFGKANHNKKTFNEWLEYNVNNESNFNLIKDIYFSPLSLTTINKVLLDLIKNHFFLSGIYNLGASSFLSKFEFALKVFEHIGVNKKNLYNIVNSDDFFQVKRPKFMQMNNKKLSKIVGPIPTLEDEIKNLYSHV